MIRPVTERTFAAPDGVELFFRHWPAIDPPKGAILLVHRGHEHGGRMAHLVDELDLPEIAFYACDARGHGRSAREPAHDVATLARDLDAFVRHVQDADGVAPADLTLVAQSVGAVIATAWVHDYAPRIRALVVASPAFDVRLYVPLARPGLALLRRIVGPFSVDSYVKARFLTHDPARITSYERDELIRKPINVDLLLDLYATSERVVADARAITVPTQLLVSGADFVVHQDPQHAFFVNLGSRTKERHVLPELYHDTLGELDRKPAVDAVRAFVRGRFAEPVEVHSQLGADRFSYTRDEAEALASPLEPWTPRGVLWRLIRAGLRVGARLSDGLAIGELTGFDSGSMLDYVYRNEALGAGPIGRLVDRIYLDSIGWRGIRQRKVHLEELIGQAVRRLRAEGRPVRVVDVAAGHGRYVLDALMPDDLRPDHVLLRDFQEVNVTAGRALIAERNLGAVATFEQGDAFDPDQLGQIDATLGIVSGLYELFADNALVARSLSGLARAIPAGGLLLYTNQPWHPQLELIARALASHRQGKAWVMRRRTQAEMDELVSAAGFDKVDQRIDRWGIFTVSLARRRA
jgi:alpha-beta hydrolase superfamily lysophospholipase